MRPEHFWSVPGKTRQLLWLQQNKQAEKMLGDEVNEKV